MEPAASGAAAAQQEDPDARWRLAERVTVTLPTGRRIVAEVARTDEQRERGLMFRSRLGRDEGMIFVYSSPTPLGIWMKNCRFPIDVLFLNEHGAPDRLRVEHLHEAVPPCAADPCPSYRCPVPVRYFLEVPAYTVTAEGLRPGDVIALERGL